MSPHPDGKPPTLDYRKGGPVGRPDRAARRSVAMGAAALMMAVLCWAWAAFTLTPLRRLGPWSNDGWFLVLPGIVTAVLLGIRAIGGGDEPMPGSRLGTWALVLVGLLWLSGLLLIHAPAGWGLQR